MLTLDPQTALVAAGYDPRRSVVVELDVKDDYAAALVEVLDEGETRLELFRHTPDRGWTSAARGDGEAVSDGNAIAAWNAGDHRIVLGYLTAEEEATPAPKRPRGPDRAVTLVWLTLLTAAIWPAAAGAYVWEGATSVSLFFVVQLTIVGVAAFLILRGLLHLWRDTAEPTRGFAVALLLAAALTLAAALFLVISYSPITDDRASSKPVGVVALLVGVNLVVLAVREVSRMRARRRALSS